MNTTEEHIEKARHNWAFLDRIRIETFADWAIVTLFYRALHLTSAVIHARADDHGYSHPMRQRAVERHFSSENALAYEQLYSRSRLLRYDQLRARKSDYTKLLKRSFLPLLQEVQRVVPGAR